jgi:hypothetical protein
MTVFKADWGAWPPGLPVNLLLDCVDCCFSTNHRAAMSAARHCRSSRLNRVET